MAKKGIILAKRKKNKQNTTKNNANETFAMVGSIDNPNVRGFIAENMVEIRHNGCPMRPIMPILGKIYYLDFSNTCCEAILEQLSLVAWALCKEHNMRTFVYEDTIYVATSHPISYVESAVADVGEFFVDVFDTLMPFMN